MSDVPPEQHELQCRGLWIPIEVFEKFKQGIISSTEAMLAGLFDALTKSKTKQGCYASNAWAGKELRCTADHVSGMVNHLITVGIFELLGYKLWRNEKRRVLVTSWTVPELKDAIREQLDYDTLGKKTGGTLGKKTGGTLGKKTDHIYKGGNGIAHGRGGLAPSGDGADPVPDDDWDNTNRAFVPATSTNGQHYHTSQDAQRAPGTKNNTRHNANSSQSAARGPKPNTTEQDITVARALLAAALRKVNRLTTPAEVPGWADAVAVLRRKLQLTPERLHRVLVEGYAKHVDRIDKPIIDCKKKISPDVFNWLAEQADKLLPPPPVELTEDARKVLDQLANCRFPVPQQTLGAAVQRSLDAYRAHCKTVRQVAADHPRQPGKRSHPATVYAEDLAGAVTFVTRWFDGVGSYLGQHPDRAGDFIKVYAFTPYRDQYTAMGVKSMTEYYGGGGPARWQELMGCCQQYENGIR